MSERNYDVLKTDHGLVKMWTRGVPVADNAIEQLRNLADLPFVPSHIAAMPDCHWGMGSTVGSVIPTLGAVIPAAVGVDIGCGMCAMRTDLDLNDIQDLLPDIRARLEAAIPHGRTAHGQKEEDVGSWGSRGDVPDDVKSVWKSLVPGYERILAAAPKINRHATLEHLGTLGSGNHFIEVTVDTEEQVWLFLHSGSRGPGARVGNYYMRKAKDLAKMFMSDLPDPDLAFFPKGHELFGEYMFAVSWAQRFAKENRALMMSKAYDVLQSFYQTPIQCYDHVDCHHNYVAQEKHFGEKLLVTRKGATRAGQGEVGLIPGSMGAKSFIVKGLGNRDSFESCSHGAGRVMSRGAARKTITVDDHIAATEGVECRKDDTVLDESPAAYKDIDAVMAAQADLVEIAYTLKAVVCVKG